MTFSIYLSNGNFECLLKAKINDQTLSSSNKQERPTLNAAF